MALATVRGAPHGGSTVTLTTHAMFSSRLATIAGLTCNTWSGRDRERCDARSSITIVRRGVYAYHARRQATVADPGSALLYRSPEPYSLSHPFRRDLPDRSTRIEFDDSLLEEAFGARPLARDVETHLSADTQILHVRTLSVLGPDGRDRLAASVPARAQRSARPAGASNERQHPTPSRESAPNRLRPQPIGHRP